MTALTARPRPAWRIRRYRGRAVCPLLDDGGAGAGGGVGAGAWTGGAAEGADGPGWGAMTGGPGRQAGGGICAPGPGL